MNLEQMSHLNSLGYEKVKQDCEDEEPFGVVWKSSELSETNHVVMYSELNYSLTFNAQVGKRLLFTKLSD